MVPTFQALQILIFLLPGFVTAAVINFLFVARRKTPLDKIIEALFYSFVNYSIFTLLLNRYPDIQPLSVVKQTGTSIETYILRYNSTGFLYILAIAVSLGLFISFLSTKDLPTRFLRQLKITTRTSRSSVWSDVFHDKAPHAYVIVNLVNGQRIMGWPLYYSDTPEESSIFLSDAYWIGEKNNKIKIPGPGVLITSATKIESVEFLSPK